MMWPERPSCLAFWLLLHGPLARRSDVEVLPALAYSREAVVIEMLGYSLVPIVRSSIDYLRTIA